MWHYIMKYPHPSPSTWCCVFYREWAASPWLHHFQTSECFQTQHCSRTWTPVTDISVSRLERSYTGYSPSTDAYHTFQSLGEAIDYVKPVKIHLDPRHSSGPLWPISCPVSGHFHILWKCERTHGYCQGNPAPVCSALARHCSPGVRPNASENWEFQVKLLSWEISSPHAQSAVVSEKMKPSSVQCNDICTFLILCVVISAGVGLWLTENS